MFSVVFEAGEDQIAYDAAERASHRSLSIEERQSSSELEACVEEGEVGYGDRIESGW